MAEARAWRGFPPDQALWRLLRRKGQEEGFQAFRDSRWQGAHPDQMAAVLEGQGIQARPAKIQEADLPYLEAPTLAELKDGTWILLEGRQGGRYRVESPEGSLLISGPMLAEQGSGRILDLSPGLPPGDSLWSRLKPLFLRHRRCLLQIGMATLLLQGLALATPAVTAGVVDRALPDGARSTLLLVLAGMGLATLNQVWIGWIQGRLLLFILTRVDLSAERGFLEHLLRCPFPYLQSLTLGELMQAFQGWAAARELLPAKTVGAFLSGAVGLLYLGVMAFLLPGLTALVVAGTGVLALATFLVGRSLAKLQSRRVEAEAREQGALAELVAGIATLKAAGAEARAQERWRGRCRPVLALAWTQGRLSLGSELAMGLVTQALALALLTRGGMHLLAGTLEIGRLFAFLQMSAGFTGSVMALVHTSLALLQLGPQLKRAQEILSMEGEPPPQPAPPGALAAAVEAEDLWFRYAPGGPWVLQGASLRLDPGEKTRLEGPSGFGKSTLLRLMAGLHPLGRGRILVAGRSPRDARSQIAYLPQFVRIFGGSVMDNLRIFSHGADRETILDVARRTGLMAWLDTLPMGLQTLLPPGGRTLSGGQRQLIALTGTLASGRSLLLLDEPLANLDPARAAELERLIQEGPWTVVAASHGHVEGGSPTTTFLCEPIEERSIGTRTGRTP